MVHPSGVQYASKIKAKDRQTSTLSVTGNLRVASPMANPSEPPDHEKAPDLATTGSRAETTSLAANGDESCNLGRPIAQRIPGTLSLRFGPPDPSVIVEPTLTGLYRVNVRPILSHRQLERSFPYAAQALDYAAMLEMDHDWPVIDRTEAAA